MADVHLRFGWTVVTGTGTVPLRFGDRSLKSASIAADFPALDVPDLTAAILAAVAPDAAIAADFPPPDVPSLAAALIAVVVGDTIEAAISADFPPPDVPSLTAAIVCDTESAAVFTDEGPAARMVWQEAIRVSDHGTRIRHLGAAWLTHSRMALAQASTLSLPSGSGIQQAQAIRLDRGSILVDAAMLQLYTGCDLEQAEALYDRHGLSLLETAAIPLDSNAGIAHAETDKIRPGLAFSQHQAIPDGSGVKLRQQFALLLAARLRIGQQQAIYPPPGFWRPPYPPGPRPGPVHLRFSWEADGSRRLRFGIRPWIRRVPIREVYIVIHTFFLVRADDSTPIEALDFSANIDADSWGWSWSARVPGSYLSLIRETEPGEFVELIATLDGTPLRLVVESIRRDRSFGSSVLALSGRGRAAWLADPHSPIITRLNAESLTAQQLLADALSLNGVPIGWDIEWGLTDWSVPAGLWSYTGTYIGAALRIAEAGGGYIQAHDTDETLIVRPYYPWKPWEWATTLPTLILPEDVCVTEGIEWMEKPAYNAIWVVGQTDGRQDKVIRAGSAGDFHAPTVVDPLATDIAMTRQRGTRILADTGRQAHISLSLPVLPETGIIKPGELIQYTEHGTEHIGISRAVSVRYSGPSLTQTIRIETHEL